ncbi:MAG TPA: hypothetical protein VNQ78_13405 [Paracoccus sp. (in: a-proteobacteria)]|uniref:hypothetical protein n=1 Tax=Paracoccus sp. TaxID=267 RepID=UPI002B697AFA|nr:hypothetical protein [Paracoccus sp. (in: a-proteobacteria)]HWL57652.1 hypothetical protein [Paracoccus sp. (in: a-proteobacteria)]
MAQSLKSAVGRIRIRIIAAIGLVAAIVLTWWMKVEDARIPDAPPPIAFGQPVSVGRSVFIPEKLALANDENGERKLVLTGLIENVTGSTQVAVFGFPEMLPVLSSGDTEFPAPRVNLVRDDDFLKQLEPRIREAIAIIWDVPPDWQAQDVLIAFSAQQFKLNDNLYSKSSWLQFHPTGRLTARPEQGA